MEARRVDGRHPDSCLVHLEEVCDEGVEVDVLGGKEVEGQFLAVHLEFCVEDFHVKAMLDHFLLADTFCFGFVSFFFLKGLDFVVLGEAFDHFGFEIGVSYGCALLRCTCDIAFATWTDSVGIEEVACASTSLLTEHHEPTEVLFCVLVLVLSSDIEGDVDMLNTTKISTSICFDDDKISFLDRESCSFLNVEDVGSATFEVDNVERCSVGAMERADA